MIANQIGCKVDDICDFELQVCDTQPSVIAGAAKEFIFSGRLDNLCSSFCSLKVLCVMDFLDLKSCWFVSYHVLYTSPIITAMSFCYLTTRFAVVLLNTQCHLMSDIRYHVGLCNIMSQSPSFSIF